MLIFGCWHKVHDALTLRKDLASEMAPVKRFELPTHRLEICCSIQLS